LKITSHILFICGLIICCTPVWAQEAGHDAHAGHDHAGHDHAGHDHAKPPAKQDAHAGHDHAGHDHAGHDHAGHDHAKPPAKQDAHAGHDHAGHGHDGNGAHQDGQDAHGSKAHHDGKHHLYFSDDDDGDGIPNWRDRYQHEEPNFGDPKKSTYQVSKLLLHAFNLALLLGVIFWFGRKPITDGLRDRAKRIRQELTDSARLRDEAQQRYEEVDARLRHIAEEIENLKIQGAEQAQQEEIRLIERATSEAQRIEHGAKRHIRDALVRARVELRDEAVSLAIEMAENIVKNEVTGDDQTRLAKAFLGSLDSDEGATNAP
jgi:F-type H+-transporting ATPase subunit b